MTNTIVLVVIISSVSDEDSETSDTLHVSVLDLKLLNNLHHYQQAMMLG